MFKEFSNSGLRVRLVQPINRDDEGDATRSLVLLTPVRDQLLEEQTLNEHVGKVESEARKIADSLGLTGCFRDASLFAAKWHDEGKKAEIWQRFIGQAMNGPLLGKAATTRDPKTLHGYRHEFGSLLRVNYPERYQTDSTLPTDPNTRDLALHLIATHHGFGRPHFDTPMDRGFRTAQCEAIHTDVMRCFARLQRKHGWWCLAWLENLLRCADALASADDDDEDDVTDELTDFDGGKE